MHIVVLAHQGLGDCCLALPLLRRLDAAAACGGGRLTIVAKSRLEHDLFSLIEWESQCSILWGQRRGLRGALAMLKMAWWLRRQRPDVLLAPLLVDRLQNAVWLKIVGASLVVTPGGRFLRWATTHSLKWNRTLPEHQVDYYARFGDVLALPRWPDEGVSLLRTIALRRSDPGMFVLGIGPGSGEYEAHKRWPVGKYVELLVALARLGGCWKVILYGSAQERDLLDVIREGVARGPLVVEMLCGAPLKEVVVSLQQCDCMVAGTVGLGHLASACGVPVVTPCEPTNPWESGPCSLGSRPVRAGLSCAPCYRQEFRQGCGELNCMELVPVEGVVRAVIATVKGDPVPPTQPLVTKDSWHACLSSGQCSDGLMAGNRT